MRFLGVSETCDLGALYLSLQNEGHDVRVAISEPEARGTLAGMVVQVTDWRSQVAWIREAGANGVILFESVSEGFGQIQDSLRADGLQVIGGSAFGDRLENDRAFAQRLLAELGFPTGHVHEFASARDADGFIAAHPKRYVLKFSGPNFCSSDNYIGQFDDGRDVRAMLRRRRNSADAFILMDFIEGIEMGVGAYFDGSNFILPACLDWEHKRLFAGDMGELTGEMGTVATFDRSAPFFQRTLALVEPLLRGHGHVGYVNLNTIVNAEGIWPLEFTCRFGYPGYAVLAPLQGSSWSDLFRMMLRHREPAFETRRGFSVGVLLTTPPFPYTRKQISEPIGLPILFSKQLTAKDRRHLHFGEVGLVDHGLATSGLYGWTMVVTGCGRTIALAQKAAYALAKTVRIPNVRYRLDIGDKLACQDYDRLKQMGFVGITQRASRQTRSR